MREGGTRRYSSSTALTVVGALMIMLFFAATAAPQLAPKPHYLGVKADLSASSISGVRVLSIDPGSPAEQAELHVGDIIVKLGTVAIKNPQDLVVALKSTLPGRPTDIVYLRQDKEARTQVSLQGRR